MFNRWVAAERFKIAETSGDISGGLRALWEEARATAAEHGLEFVEEQDEVWGFVEEQV